jgi:uncharacterized protein YceK
MKNLFVLIAVSIFLSSCATTLSRMTPQVGETWRARCYEKENPMDFEITSVRMGFTTYKDSSATYKIPTYTFQKEFVRTCLAGSTTILVRRPTKESYPRHIYSEERSVTSR